MGTRNKADFRCTGTHLHGDRDRICTDYTCVGDGVWSTKNNALSQHRSIVTRYCRVLLTPLGLFEYRPAFCRFCCTNRTLSDDTIQSRNNTTLRSGQKLTHSIFRPTQSWNNTPSHHELASVRTRGLAYMIATHSRRVRRKQMVTSQHDSQPCGLPHVKASGRTCPCSLQRMRVTPSVTASMTGRCTHARSRTLFS